MKQIILNMKLLIGAIAYKIDKCKDAFEECKKSRQVTMGKNSRLYPESIVNNLQTPDKIVIGDNTHVRGELCIYPYGGAFL